MQNFANLSTARGEALPAVPWEEYPRPGMRRDSFYCLNGIWKLAVGDGQFDRSIMVPFPPESRLSGVHEVFPEETSLTYLREFFRPEGFETGRVLLHFGAIDQMAWVTLNGVRLGKHVGGYAPFSFDVTDVLQKENVLEVRVEDHLESHILPYGKQRRDRGGMWYTPVSGIWQTVWMERVPDVYIRELHFSVEEDAVTMELVGPAEGTLRIQTPCAEVSTRFSGRRVTVPIENPRYWSPEDPYLYKAEIETAQDRVQSYFAFRKLDTRTVDGIPRLCLNGKPYFFHGMLDQGYWSDGLWTPAAPQCFEEDILAMKGLGFNTLRKHIKVEPELFYYACDRLGMVVFQDMVNNGSYSFLRDTALPTLGLQCLPDRFLNRDEQTRRSFLEGMEETVLRLQQHPSVCYWTIFNEGWGQFDSGNVYKALKELDCSRFVDTASGWFRGAESDVESLHVYFKPVKLPKRWTRPLVLSEFGGYSYRPEGHVYNLEKNYGYRSFPEANAFMDGLEALYVREIIPAKQKGLCAAILTQLSDVEDETNGLLSFDRKVCKVNQERMRAISRKLTEPE